MSEVLLVKPGEGEKTLITGFNAIYRTNEDITGDLLDYFELVVPAGKGAPLHIHHKNDEYLNVIE